MRVLFNLGEISCTNSPQRCRLAALSPWALPDDDTRAVICYEALFVQSWYRVGGNVGKGVLGKLKLKQLMLGVMMG